MLHDYLSTRKPELKGYVDIKQVTNTLKSQTRESCSELVF